MGPLQKPDRAHVVRWGFQHRKTSSLRLKLTSSWKWAKRALIFGGVSIAGYATFRGLDYAFDLKGHAGYYTASVLGKRVVDEASQIESMHTKRQLLYLLKLLSSKPRTAKLLAEQNDPDALCEMLLLSDPVARSFASEVLCNMVTADPNWAHKLLESGKVHGCIAPLVKIVEKEHQQRKEHNKPISQEEINTKRNTINLLVQLLANPNDSEQVIKQMGWKSLLALCTHGLSDNFESNQALQSALSSVLVNMSKEQNVHMLGKARGIRLLNILAGNTDVNVTRNAARTIANVAVHDNLSRTICRRGALDIVDKLLQESQDFATRKQVARIIANFAVQDGVRDQIVKRGWLKHLTGFLTTSDSQLQLATLLALGNLAAAFPLSKVGNIEPDESITLAASLFEIWRQRLQKEHQVEDAQNATEELNQTIILQQLIRTLLHLSLDNGLVVPLFTYFPPSILADILSAVQEPSKNDRDVDIKAMRQVAMTIGNMSHNNSLSLQMLHESNWKAIVQMTTVEDTQVQHQLARTVANIAVHARGDVKIAPGIDALLAKWRKSPDVILRSHAIRGTAVLALVGPKYPEGIHLLYPVPQELEKGKPGTARASIKTPPHDYDIVLIHGVTGHPYGTWFTEEIEANDMTSSELDNYESWPRDWLTTEIPGLRVISVGYEMFLSKWTGSATPLKDQSKTVLENLKLAGVGSKPTIFITHSMGGLITLQVLKYASEQEEYRSLLSNTKGIVFYSTPHRGVSWTDLAAFPVNNFFFRSTSAIEDLRPNSEHLIDLNTTFPEFAPHISTLSYGETVTCLGGPSFNCYQVVTDESGDPGWDKLPKPERYKHVEHRYIKTDVDHLNVHRPTDKLDPRYQNTLQFIRRLLQPPQQGQQSQ